MARHCLTLLAVLSVTASCTEVRARERALEAEWGSELQAPNAAIGNPRVVEHKSPIKRVVALLTKMKEELDHEAAHEAEMYDKMVCWCETNEKEKTQAIADADAKDKLLTSEIESRSGRFGSLSTEIEALKKEIKELKEAMDKATAIRDESAKAFANEQSSLSRALANIKNAIIILGKHNSFVQVGSTVMLGVKTVLRDLAMQHELLVDHTTSMKRATGVQSALIALGSTSERASLRAAQGMSRELLHALDVKAAGNDQAFPLKFAERLLAQTAKSAPATAPMFLQLDKPPSYAAASGPVFGMLKQMQDDFDLALAKAKEDEKIEVNDFEELAGAKKAQIDASKEKLDDLEDEEAENTKALSDAKEDLESTRLQRGADVKFLTNLKVTCQGLNAQWEARSKTRSQEILAVSEALTIITEDDNADMLRGAVTFLQLGSKAKDTRRQQASDVLQDGLNDMFDNNGASDLLSAWEGRHGGSAVKAVASDSLHRSRTQLAALAITVRLDSFDKVLASMDKLATELKKQQKEEVEFKAKCTKDLHGNEKALFEKNDEKQDLEAAIKEFEASIAKLGKEIEEDTKQIADTNLEKKKASQNREAENTQFQSVVSDQRATQEILKKALAKLKGFYKKTALLQARAAQAQDPPVQFGKFKDNAGASPVIAMIENIIEDSKKLEHESEVGEKEAQADYEKFVKDSNDLIKTLTESNTEKGNTIATADGKLATAKGDLETTDGLIEDLTKVEGDLHAECDWLMKNFDKRQLARGRELESIQAAKGILKGAKSS